VTTGKTIVRLLIMRISETTSWRWYGFATAFSVLLAIGGCASSNHNSAGAVAPEGVDLSGTWVFSEAESDSTGELGQMMRDPQYAEAGMPGGQGRRPTGGMGGARPTGGMSGGRPTGVMGGMGGRGGMPQGSRIDPEKMRLTMQLALDARRKFTIVQTDTSVSFLTEWRQSPALRFGGDEIEEEQNLGNIKTSAGWVGYGLVVERKVDGGGTVLERYVLSPDSDQLFVVTQVEMGQTGREPLEFRRVYDPAER
jgi:hypothetical protein